jgi:hypothetical protein
MIAARLLGAALLAAAVPAAVLTGPRQSSARAADAAAVDAVFAGYGPSTPGCAVGIAGRGALVGFPLELMDEPADLSAVLASLLDFVAP